MVSGGVLRGGESFDPPDAGGGSSGGGPPDAGGGSSGGMTRAGLVVGVLAVVLLAVGGAAWALTQRGSTSDPASEGDLTAEDDRTGDEDPAAPEASSTTESTVDVNTTQVAAGEASTSTTAASTTTSASSTTTTTAVAGLSATITDIAIDGGRYAVSYSTNFSPLISSDPSSTHLHFFFDTVPVAQAGVPGGGPWILYDGPDPFTGYGPADRPSVATQMCVTAANHAHEVVDPAIYHCMDLPDA